VREPSKIRWGQFFSRQLFSSVNLFSEQFAAKNAIAGSREAHYLRQLRRPEGRRYKFKIFRRQRFVA